MNVTRGVIVTLSIALLGLLLVGAYGLWGLQQSEKRSLYVQNNTLPAIKALSDARSALNSGRIANFLHASTFQATRKAVIRQQITNDDMAMDKALAEYQQTLVSGAIDSAMLSADQAALTAYRTEREYLLEKSANNDTAGAHKLLTISLADKAASLDAALSAHIAYNNKLAAALNRETADAFTGTTRTLVAAIVAGFLLVCSLAVYLLRIIRNSQHGIQHTLDRTRELREAQTALMATARKAGMAEIANNVLHNIGNVLNSVNVSAGLVSSQVRDSKTRGLARAVQLMNEHATDLGEFLTHDEKGKLLPDYLNKLVAALAAEQRGIIEELGSLSKSIEHIKDIVATQQSYAGAVGVIEPVQVSDLLEDALRMHAGALTRHHVTVVRQFADLPMLPLDRHQLLQILINLIGNAKQAMAGVTGRPHRMTLGINIVDSADGRRLRICVEDEGEGIAPEHMAQLFVHGFTTRKNGHGFGLHSCALAAKEMGGTLVAHSDGPGGGATFTLELPINPNPAVAQSMQAGLAGASAAKVG